MLKRQLKDHLAYISTETILELAQKLFSANPPEEKWKNERYDNPPYSKCGDIYLEYHKCTDEISIYRLEAVLKRKDAR